jgi:hypothetical protein
MMIRNRREYKMRFALVTYTYNTYNIIIYERTSPISGRNTSLAVIIHSVWNHAVRYCTALGFCCPTSVWTHTHIFIYVRHILFTCRRERSYWSCGSFHIAVRKCIRTRRRISKTRSLDFEKYLRIKKKNKIK